MVETIIMLKPKDQWRPGITKRDIVQELDAKLQIPGVRNGWTQPIINRINMLSTGVRTDIGFKVFGDNLDTLEHYAIKAEQILRTYRALPTSLPRESETVTMLISCPRKRCSPATD